MYQNGSGQTGNGTMQNWDEVRTAFQVARMGTVSGAADVLGVHHATVIRHIDALEKHLGVKLFQRHARGYTPTEAGTDLLRVAQATEDQFGQLVSRIKGQGADVSGDLVVTSLASLAPRITPLLVAFQEEYNAVVVRYLTGDRLFRLEYGEAHVAIRAGVAPNQPDNVAQPLMDQAMGLYASKAYVAKYGMPAGPEDYGSHRFVGHEDAEIRAPFFQWLGRTVPRENVVFRSDDLHALELAVRRGAGIGFLTEEVAAAQPDLLQVAAPLAEWATPLWLVTHVDLHRTSKVQALVQFLKAHIKDGYL
jgi:DNA-binding transcriptional LysR family regulator